MAEKEYIDREILLKMNFYTENCNSEENRWNDYAIKDIIRHIPAADVAPVRHGRWYSRGGRFRCSVCDNKAFLKDIGGTGGWSHEYEQQKSPYCPNCGAKMDGGNDNDR